MANFTKNYNLEKPLPNENYNIDVFNQNTETIDAELKKVNEKADSKVTKQQGKSLSTNDYTTAEKNKLKSLHNYNDTTVKKNISDNTKAISDRVTKVSGKGLSTNDYTTAEKNKLGSLHNYDDTQVKKDITANKTAITTNIKALATKADKEQATHTHFQTDNIYLRGNSSNSGIFKLMFKAPIAFTGELIHYRKEGEEENENITYTLFVDGEKATEAWKADDIVTLSFDSSNHKAFFKSGGGGGGKLNIFAQPTAPTTFEGIWLETTDKFKKVQTATDVLQSGDFTKGNIYADMPSPRENFDGAVVGNKIYCFGGYGNSGAFSDMYVYDTVNNIWTLKASTTSEVGISQYTVSVVGTDIYYIGGLNAENDRLNKTLVYHTLTDGYSIETAMPTVKFGLNSAVVGNKIYCFGGATITPLNTVEIYDTTTNTWSTGTNMPIAIYRFGCSVVGTNIYCIAGCEGGNSTRSSVYIYDTINNTWSTGSSMTQGTDMLRTVTVGYNIYAIGGHRVLGSGGKTLSQVQIYNTLTDTWSSGDDMPMDRYNFCCGVVLDKIYCIGGYSTSTSIHIASTDVFNLTSNKWSLNADLRQKKIMHRSVSVRNKIYTFGGYDGNKILNTVEIYDTVNNTWSTGSSMPTAKRRFGCVYNINNNKIYCIGGDPISHADSVDIYDITTNTWSTGTNMPTGREIFGCTIINNKIYCIGGLHNQHQNAVEIYDTETNTWSTGASLSIASYDITSITVGNYIYCMGGKSADGTLFIVRIYDTVNNTWSTGTNMITIQEKFNSIKIGTNIYCLGGINNSGNIVSIYNTITNEWSLGTNMLTSVHYHSLALVNNKIYCMGGEDNHSNNYLRTTQIMNLIPTPFPEDTLVLQVPTVPMGKYYSQLLSVKNLLGDRMLTSFENAWIYKNSLLNEYPAYYGDGKQWVKFKN